MGGRKAPSHSRPMRARASEPSEKEYRERKSLKEMNGVRRVGGEERKEGSVLTLGEREGEV